MHLIVNHVQLMENRIVLVLGASTNPERYSFRAINKLLDHGYKVAGIGNRAGVVRTVEFIRSEELSQPVHTVTLYLGPANQKPYYDFILSLKPERIIFNPGTENEEFITMARSHGIHCVKNCTLVMIDTGIF